MKPKADKELNVYGTIARSNPKTETRMKFKNALQQSNPQNGFINYGR